MTDNRLTHRNSDSPAGIGQHHASLYADRKRRPDLIEGDLRLGAHADHRLGLIEVLREPAEEEREAGAEDQAGVDVGGRLDDTLFQQVANLVREGLEYGNRQLIDRPRCLFQNDDLAVS